MSNKLFLSASDIVKRSASQILYLAVTKEKVLVTDRQVRGNEYAETISKGFAQEMRGTVSSDDFVLFFCIDKVSTEERYGEEIKMIEDPSNVPTWLFQSSLMQSYFYFRLLKEVNFLDTPKFRLNEGYEQRVIKLDEHPIDSYRLNYGNMIYNIGINNDKLFNHFIKKCNLLAQCYKMASVTQFEPVKQWDSKYKFKEYSMFYDSISHELIEFEV